MYGKRTYKLRLWLASITAGGVFLLGDCDPTIQATVEEGIIDVSTGLLTAFSQALIQVFTEAAAA